MKLYEKKKTKRYARFLTVILQIFKTANNIACFSILFESLKFS